nr:6-phosphogluconolactonase [Melanopsichium pennsylvanicum 4]
MTLFAAGYNGTIIPYSLNPTDPAIKPISPGVQPNASGTSPSWIAFSSSSRKTDTLYAVTDFYSVDEASPGRVFSHTYDPSTGAIVQSGSPTQRSNGTSAGGDGPVSCLVGHGPSKNLLFVANYNSGTASVIPINPPDGTLAEEPKEVFQFTRPSNQPKIGPVADRQDHSYAHQVSISPSGRWVYVCDLGADQIHHLRIHPNGEVKFTASTDVKVGSGPRHITFHKDCKGQVSAYLASELDNTVSSFKVNEDTGELKLIGDPILASPPGVPLSGEGILPTNRTTAEIAVVPAGDFVYVSNRGDEVEDHISIFKRDQQTGELSFQEWVKSGGRMPRHFSLSSDTRRDDQAKWLVVGHQTDQNIVVYERDATTGKLAKRDTRPDVGQVAFTGFSPF